MKKLTIIEKKETIAAELEVFLQNFVMKEILLVANLVRATEWPNTSISIIWVVNANSPVFHSPASQLIIILLIDSELNIMVYRIV